MVASGSFQRHLHAGGDPAPSATVKEPTVARWHGGTVARSAATWPQKCSRPNPSPDEFTETMERTWCIGGYWPEASPCFMLAVCKEEFNDKIRKKTTS